MCTWAIGKPKASGFASLEFQSRQFESFSAFEISQNMRKNAMVFDSIVPADDQKYPI